jgi:hypothetical protein
MKTLPLLTRRTFRNLGDGTMQTNVIQAGPPVVDQSQVYGTYSAQAQAAAQAASNAAYATAVATTLAAGNAAQTAAHNAQVTASNAASNAAQAVMTAQTQLTNDTDIGQRGA